MYGEQNNTRLYRVAMVAIFYTVLCGANASDHGRHINCNGTRQYQPKGNDYMRHAKCLVSPCHDGVMTSKRFHYYCLFVRRNHCSPVNSPHKGPWMRSFEVSFVDSLKNHENKQLVARVAWWRHQMVHFPSQMPMTRNVDVLFGPRLNKWLSKQSRRRWFQLPSRSLWHQSDGPCVVIRRRDANVAAPYWDHILVLTTQGKCFPNFEARPWFKRYISLQWRCMSDIVSWISVNTTFVQELYSWFAQFNV